MRIRRSIVRESKNVLDSRFQSKVSRFQALNSSLRWWKLDPGLQLLVKCQIQKAMILDSTGKIFRDSGFHEQSFWDYGIRIPLTWGDLYLGFN